MVRPYLRRRPNSYGCHDPQCTDSTWDHECPVVPDAGYFDRSDPICGVETLISRCRCMRPPGEHDSHLCECGHAWPA